MGGNSFVVIAIVVVPYIIIFGGLAAWLASAKDRHVGVWFLLGAVLGPLAIIVVGLAPSATVPHADDPSGLPSSLYPSAPERRAYRDALERAGRAYPSRAPDVLDAASARALAALEDPKGHEAGSTQKRCPDCAEQVNVSARICRFCRYRFDSEEQAGSG